MTKTFYYLHPDGSITERTVTGVDDVVHPEDVALLSAAEYAQRLADIQAEREREAEETRHAENEQKRADYEALIALGLPAETASRITGYYPPTEDPDPDPDPGPGDGESEDPDPDPWPWPHHGGDNGGD